MKRKTAKEILAESFREIAESKNVDRITVRDVTENCGYSSATFYRQFKDKYDLIAWEYTRELKSILSGLDGSEQAWKTALLCAANSFQKRRTYRANLFLHTSGLESFVRYMQEITFQSLKDLAANVLGDQPMDIMTEQYIRVYVFGTVQLTCEWILGRIEATPEEMATVYEQTFPSPLQKYLQ